MSTKKSVRLLIVDDSNMIRNRIARIAGSGALEGWQIAGLAANGEEALRLAATCRPDAVTLDLTMPRMDGLACIRQLRVVCPTSSILVVSALSDQSTAIRAVSLGARGFLPKPFSDAELKNALMETIAP